MSDDPSAAMEALTAEGGCLRALASISRERREAAASNSDLLRQISHRGTCLEVRHNYQVGYPLELLLEVDDYRNSRWLASWPGRAK